MTRITVSLLCAALLLISGARAHHSDQMFDHDAVVEFEAVVREFQYTNPHSWLIVDVEEKDGTVTTWGFESGPPSNLMRAQVYPADLTPGTRITIRGHPLRDGRPAAEWIDAKRLEDGKEFFPETGFQVR